MPGSQRLLSRMFDLAHDAPLWAVANEAKHWSADEVARVKSDPTAIAHLMQIPKGRQRRLTSDEAPPSQIASRPPLDRSDLEARVAEADRELAAMAFSGVRPVPLSSESFPRRLASIENPPLLLYVLGVLQSFERCVAVSGTRTPCAWGSRMAERLGRRLAEAGWVVTSGLARGIDTRAHLGALAAPKGLTVAVSALPFDRVYPAENLELAQKIVDRGALVSEHALSRGAGKLEFLRRNRIISGLAFAQFIVETSGGGGTWAQATTAKAQGRPLLALRPPRAESVAWRGFEALRELDVIEVSSVDEALRRAQELSVES